MAAPSLSTSGRRGEGRGSGWKFARVCLPGDDALGVRMELYRLAPVSATQTHTRAHTRARTRAHKHPGVHIHCSTVPRLGGYVVYVGVVPADCTPGTHPVRPETGWKQAANGRPAPLNGPRQDGRTRTSPTCKWCQLSGRGCALRWQQWAIAASWHHYYRLPYPAAGAAGTCSSNNTTTTSSTTTTMTTKHETTSHGSNGNATGVFLSGACLF